MIQARDEDCNIRGAILYDAPGTASKRYEGHVSGETIRAALDAARNG